MFEHISLCWVGLYMAQWFFFLSWYDHPCLLYKLFYVHESRIRYPTCYQLYNIPTNSCASVLCNLCALYHPYLELQPISITETPITFAISNTRADQSQRKRGRKRKINIHHGIMNIHRISLNFATNPNYCYREVALEGYRTQASYSLD